MEPDNPQRTEPPQEAIEALEAFKQMGEDKRKEEALYLEKLAAKRGYIWHHDGGLLWTDRSYEICEVTQDDFPFPDFDLFSYGDGALAYPSPTFASLNIEAVWERQDLLTGLSSTDIVVMRDACERELARVGERLRAWLDESRQVLRVWFYEVTPPVDWLDAVFHYNPTRQHVLTRSFSFWLSLAYGSNPNVIFLREAAGDQNLPITQLQLGIIGSRTNRVVGSL